MKRRTLVSRVIHFRALYLMMLPAVLFLLVNNYLPMLGSVLAFKSYNYVGGIFGSPWCGLDNFKFLFVTPDAFIITRNTLAYNFLFIVLGFVFSLSFSIALNELINKRLSQTFQTIMLFPNFLSWVVVAYLGYALMHADHGFLNKAVLPLLHIKPIDWYHTTQVWPFILPVAYLWKSVGYGTIVYLAAIAGLDQECFEAAVIDGASKWTQIRHITLPLLQPIMIVLGVLALGGIFRADFGLFYQFTMDQGQIRDVTNVIDTYVFRALMLNSDYGMSSAAGLYQSVVGFILILLSNAVVKKIDPDKALF
jgi:putative aldouronate transport system permease protein